LYIILSFDSVYDSVQLKDVQDKVSSGRHDNVR